MAHRLHLSFAPHKNNDEQKFPCFNLCKEQTPNFWRQNIVSVLYVTVFGFLAYDSLHILKPYGIVAMTLKTSANIVKDRPEKYL